MLRVKSDTVANLKGELTAMSVSLFCLAGLGKLQLVDDDGLNVADVVQIVSCIRVVG